MIYKLKRNSISQNSKKSHLNEITAPKPINLDKIKNNLKADQAVITYEIGGNKIFKCLISSLKHYCKIEVVNIDITKIGKELRSVLLSDEKTKSFSHSSQEKLYNIFFSGLTIEEFSEILFNPVHLHLGIPVNILKKSVSGNDLPVGLEKAISLLPSLIVKNPQRKT